jgi:hypothetical protein
LFYLHSLFQKLIYVDDIQKSKLTALDKFYLENHINTGIAKFTEHLQDVCSRLGNLNPPVKLNVNVFVIQDLKQNQIESKESKEDLLESMQKILIWVCCFLCLRFLVELLLNSRSLFRWAT